MTIGCLYCGLQLPDTADFCPECGRPIEDAIRVERGRKIRRTNMAIGCLYCGLQLPDTADFCPECGRSIERGFEIRPILESEFDGLGKEMKGKVNKLPICRGSMIESEKSNEEGRPLSFV